MKNIVLLGHGAGMKFVIDSMLQNETGYRVSGIVTHPLKDHSADLEMYEKRKDLYGDYAYNIFNVTADYNIPLLESPDVNDAGTIDWIRQHAPAYIISIGCRNIIKKEFLQSFTKNVLNVHTTPLPRYRGGANDSWMILNGEWGKELFGCVHYIDTGIDTGDIIAKAYYKVPERCYPVELFKVRLNTFKDLVIKALKLLADKNFIAEKQKPEDATTFPRLYTPRDGKINFKEVTGMELLRFIYAFSYPFEGAHCFYEGNKINIVEAEFYEVAEFHPFSYGLIFGRNDKNQYKVSTKGGYILLLKVEVDGVPVQQNRLLRLGKFLS